MMSHIPATSVQSWAPARCSLYDGVETVSWPPNDSKSVVVGSSVTSHVVSWHSYWAVPSWRVRVLISVAIWVPPWSRPHLYADDVGRELGPRDLGGTRPGV